MDNLGLYNPFGFYLTSSCGILKKHTLVLKAISQNFLDNLMLSVSNILL